MKCLRRLVSLLIVFICLACKNTISVEDLNKFAATETYPNDVYLDTVVKKRALIIVAHDDDDCAMSGTIAKLKQNGWTIKQFSLQNHKGIDTTKHPATLICDGNELILNDGNFRIGMDTLKLSANPLSYAEIDKQFFTDKVSKALKEKINSFEPKVIFTLDDVKGGYGHPEHVFISRLVLNLFQSKEIVCNRIYQGVYTNHMEKEIIDIWLNEQLKNWNYPNLSTTSNKLYKINGMPEPNVQININEYAEEKMNYLLAYDENVRKNIRKFIPYFEAFDAKTYFKVFDREFFRVISK